MPENWTYHLLTNVLICLPSDVEFKYSWPIDRFLHQVRTEHYMFYIQHIAVPYKSTVRRVQYSTIVQSVQYSVVVQSVQYITVQYSSTVSTVQLAHIQVPTPGPNHCRPRCCIKLHAIAKLLNQSTTNHDYNSTTTPFLVG